jgi:hypothetical protein
MTPEAVSKVLDAIHEEADRLKSYEVPADVAGGLDLIISIARHKHDIRGDEEIDRARAHYERRPGPKQ